MFCDYMDDKYNATKANQHFGHAHGHGFHGMHISPMREAMEKPSTYIKYISISTFEKLGSKERLN